MKYTIAQDFDGDWYVIPKDMLDSWEEWSRMPLDLHTSSCIVPGYARLISSPSGVTFSEYEVS